MRAFRPSHFAPADAYEEDDQRAKEENVLLYTERAQTGAPLFEAAPVAGEIVGRSSDIAVRD
jgi:hypothetical protein